MDNESQRIVGVLTRATTGWRLQSINRKERGEFFLRGDRTDFKQGELAVAKLLPRKNRYGPGEAELIEILGGFDQPRAISLIAIAQHDIPNHFDKAALNEADAAKPVTLQGRTDLRHIPFVTIDGADARDFDDAVFAEPHQDGWHLVVAIADVAHYVKSDSALDREAYKRGNSVYFADRVVPMLPEALSNELCSLKPQVERACMAAHLWINGNGDLTRWQFVRGVMRSHARLTYEQVQQAMNGNPDSTTGPLLDKAIKPLYGAFQCLLAARVKRGTLDFNLPETKVEVDQNGKVKAIKARERLDSHRLIEEFMILANVAAAAQLEGKGGICLYRVHDKPTEEKLEALREFLATFEISLVPYKQLHPRNLSKILADHAESPDTQVINEVMLRSQAQAVYSPANIGHFGLALSHYAHFTSPIRRYADLMVHRGLIRACKLGEDGIMDSEIQRLEIVGKHISDTERRAASAERESVDRFCSLYLKDKVGTVFPARISGVIENGIFVRLDETGADGVIWRENLPDDFYTYDQPRQSLTGRRTGRVYRLAQKLYVKLEKNDSLSGSMGFSVVEENSGNENNSTPRNKSHRDRDEKNRSHHRRPKHRHG